MRRLLPILLLFAACATTPSATTPSTDATADVNRVVDEWHRAASTANEEHYFGAMAPEFVFLGTDATERWDVAAFRAYAHPHFASGKGWTFVPRERHVIFSPDGNVAWFDEKLDNAKYGECRGSGVLRRDRGTWKLAHYNLTMPVPNELALSVADMIRAR
jgi:hypothetical protein